MYALIVAALLQTSPPDIHVGNDLSALVTSARAALADSPDETIRLASTGLAEFDGKPDERVVELALLLGTAHQVEERFSEAEAAYGVAEGMALGFPATSFELQIICRRAYCLRMLGDYAGAQEKLHRALDLYRGMGDDAAAAETLNELGIVYLKSGETGDAIACWRDAIAHFESIDDMTSVSLILGNLGILHGDLGQFAESVTCIEQSIALAEKHPGGASRSYNLVNLCDAYRGLGDHEQARALIDEAIGIYEASGAQYELASALTHRGLIHHDMGYHHKALEVLMRVDEIYAGLGLDVERVGTSASIARILASLERTDEALELSRESLELSRASDSKSIEVEARLALAESLAAAGDYSGALEHRNRANQIESEMHSEEHRREMERLYVELETHRRERELLQKQAELQRRLNERKTLVAGLVALLVLAASGWGFMLTRRRSHRKLMESFGALQASNAQLISREAELETALSRIHRLEGLLPICSVCKSIRDTDSEWTSLESYFARRSEVRFSHGYCPTCYDDAMTRDESPQPPA